MKTQKKTNGRIRGAAARVGVALLSLILLTGSAAMAQHPAGYEADKTVDDYMAGQAVAGESAFDYATQDLRVGVWLDREEDDVYRRGEQIDIGFETNQDAYAVVYRIDTDGEVSVLWPRSRMDDGFVFGSHEYRLPVRGGEPVRASNDAGEGFIYAIVSKYPFDLRALELDFHSDQTAQRYGFRVAGDPFLAMNEVNYAVTGLEDSGEYVVTNYARYYVHRQVEHPRYLCNQCHFDDEVAYDPYVDNCTLTIRYDYHWSNNWYDTYGYYPVYWNPVYAYVDPWTMQPWVNFWYRPYYRCAPSYGWYGSYWGSWVWYDSPYYRGDSWVRWDGGHRRYRPLSRYAVGDEAHKTREYSLATQMVKSGKPTERQRSAMNSRSPLAAPRGGASVAGGATRVASRGEKPTVSNRSRLDAGSRTRVGTKPGLRIRDGSDPASVRASSRADGPTLRHRSGGQGSRGAQLAPATRSTRVRSGTESRGSTSTIRSGSRQSSGAGDRSIKSVPPRQRGSRVWNTRRSESSRDGGGTSSGVRSGTSRTGRESGERQVRPQAPQRENRSGRTGTVRKRDTSRPSAPAGKVKPRQESGSRKSSTTAKPRRESTKKNSGSSKSNSGTRSNSSKSGSRSGNSSRKSGGSSRSKDRG